MTSELLNFAILVGIGIIAFVGIGIALQLLQQREARKQQEAARKHRDRET
jgi:hypothetical protein